MELSEKIIPDFLSGGGEMGELIRAMDWSKNSLGDPGEWSQSLRTSVSICLNSSFPILIWWGTDLIKIYNDAYCVLIAAKHPKAMGANGADVWPEIWHIIGPMLQGVLHNGEATWSEDQQLIIERNGYPEECYFTFSYSAIRDETGKIAGVFCAVNETTQKVLREKHLSKQVTNLFKQAPVALCILRGAEYVVDMANEKMLELWGKQEGQVLNKPIFEAMPDVKGQGFEELLNSVYTTGKGIVLSEFPTNILRNGVSEDIFLKFVYEALYNEDGTILGVMSLAHEITEQVLARKKIEESEAFNRTVLESSPDCLKVIDGEGRLVFMNSNGLCAMEIDDFAAVKQKRWWDMWGDENRDIVKAAVAQALGGKMAYFQALNPTAKGTPKWWDVIVSPVLEDSGKKVSHIISVSRDITEQKQADLKLAESEFRYHNMVHSSPSGISILQGPDLIVTTANDAIINILGKGDDIIGNPFFELMPELLAQGYGEVYQDVFKTGKPFFANEAPVNIMRYGKMELRYLNFSLQAQRNTEDEIVGIGIIASEVTSQAQYNLKIKESEERFRLLADQIPMIAFIIEPDAEATVSYWNKTWLDYTGQTYKKALGRAWLGIIHPDDLPGVMAVYLPAFEKHQPYYLPAIRVKRYDGEYRWHIVKANPRYMANGEFMGYIGVGFDVHESKLAEKALEESESHFRLMADLMPAKVTNTDTEGGVTYCNKSWLDYTGLDFEEFKTFGYHNIIHPDELKEFQDRFQKASDTGTDLEMEMRFKNKAGEYKWHQNHASPAKDENGNIQMWIGVTTEIQKIKEEDQRKGAFLKMVSHELKTPVTSIKGYVQFLLKTLKEEQEKLLHPLPLKSSLLRIDMQLVRLTRLIDEILDLSRVEEGKLELQNKLINLNDLVIETVEDIRHTNPKHIINVAREFDCTIYGDKDRIGQVIINLVNNAIKYSANSDKIEISVHENDHNQVSVSVEDYGIGIDKEDQGKIFERFYRVEGKSENIFAGFGIGLFIASEIIKRHSGFLTIKSEKGHGSVFTFTLPCATEKTAKNKEIIK